MKVGDHFTKACPVWDTRVGDFRPGFRTGTVIKETASKYIIEYADNNSCQVWSLGEWKSKPSISYGTVQKSDQSLLLLQ